MINYKASNTKIDFKRYKAIVFDFDGVILNSNKIKEKAIKSISEKYLNHSKSNEFTRYFIENNGMPRELKILKFFNKKTAKVILDEYNNLLKEELTHAKFTNCFEILLEKLNKINIKPFILSGGDSIEIIKLLKIRNKLDYFSKVYGGPNTKSENLKSMKLEGKTLFIGDSEIDYQTAKRFNLDFIFMYRYTQFFEWKNFFKKKENIIIIKDLADLIED